MPFGWLVLGVLTAAAALASTGIAARLRPSGRAELGVAATLVFLALVAAPVHVLGYANALTATRLAAVSALWFGAAIAAPARSTGLRAHVEAAAEALAGLVGLAWAGPREAYRARSLVTLGLVVSGVVIAASAWITYLAPSESWDGLFYHEPMVGFAIQNHGFRLVDLPRVEAVQATNGYPRLCESIALWFVVFTDRSLVEIGNTLAAPGLMLAVFAIARRGGRDRVIAMGWASVLLLMPASWTQLRTSMIDLEVAFFLLAALHFATRPALRVRDAAMCGLALVVLALSKSTALVWAPPIATIAAARLVYHHGRARPREVAVVVVVAACALAGAFALTFVRNWRAFGNPLWPITYDAPSLGIHWAGLQTLASMVPSPRLAELASVKYGLPVGGVDDVIRRDYGYGIPWVVLPLGAIALAFASVAALRELRRRTVGDAARLWLLSLPGLLSMKLAPTLAIARFNLHVAATFAFAVSWLAARKTTRRFGEGAVTAAIVLSILPLFWMKGWYWGMNLDVIAALRAHTAAQRASMNVEGFQMPAAVARRREIELRDGDVVAFDQDLAFPGVLWNARFSNRAVFVPFGDPNAFFARLDALGAKWVVVGNSAKKAFLQRTDRWELVGEATHVGPTLAFRRR